MFTKPHEVIAITSILPVSRESVCRSELTDDTHLAVYAVSTQPATESPTQVTIGAQSPSNDLTAEEPYAGFNAQVQQILSEADASTMKRIAKDSKRFCTNTRTLSQRIPWIVD